MGAREREKKGEGIKKQKDKRETKKYCHGQCARNEVLKMCGKNRW